MTGKIKNNNYIRVFLSKGSQFIWTGLLLSFTVFIFIPLDVYTNAPGEFNAGYISIILSFMPLAIIAALIVVAIGFVVSIIHKRLGDIFNLVVFILSICIWVQAFILMSDYGILDGSEIDWSKYSYFFKIEIVVWLLIMLQSITLRKKISAHLKSICLVLIGYQLLTSASSAIMVGNDIRLLAMQEDVDPSFSKDHNVLILVLDSFSGSVFQNIITEEAEYAEYFDGFTFFSDAMGGYSVTWPSVPLILTGQFYQNEEKLNDFIVDIGEKSILRVLQQYGYDANEVSFGATVHPSLAKEKENKENELRLSYGESMNLYELSGFRILPSIYKKYPLGKYYSNKFLRQDLVIMNSYMNMTNNSNTNNTINYVHLLGNHAPYIMDENLTENLLMGYEGIYRQGKGVLKIAGNIISSLKKASVYDNTLIFIIGDHGDLNASPNPLFLVKKFSEHGELKENDAPVHLMDICKSITEYLNINSEYPGYSIFNAEEIPKDRVRTYYGPSLSFADGYVTPLEKYIAIGKHDSTINWINTYKVYNAGEVVKTASFDIGAPIVFNNYYMKKFLLNGFGDVSADPPGVWTLFDKQRIVIPLSETPDKDIILNIRLTQRQPIYEYSDVYVNGFKIGRIEEGDGWDWEYKFPIDKDFLIHDNLLIIDFDTSINDDTAGDNTSLIGSGVGIFITNVLLSVE